MIDRSVIPSVQNRFSITPFEPDEIKLDNGASCFFIDGPKEQVLKINIIFYAGGKYAMPHIAKLANVLPAEGSVALPGSLLANELDKYGAYFFQSVNNDFASMTIICQKQYLENVLPLFFDAVMSPEMNPSVFQTKCKRSYNRSVEAYMQNGTLSDERLLPLVFGSEHPYSRVIKPEHYQNVPLDDVKQFHQQYYSLSNAFLMVVGHIDDEVKSTVSTIANKYSKSGTVQKQAPFTKNPMPGSTVKLSNPYSQQANVSMGQATITKGNEDYIPLKITTTLLGGFFGSRLMQNVREKSGYTYGIYATLMAYENIGMLKISSDVKGDKANEVDKQIKENIEDLQRNKVGTEELQRLKNYLNGELLSSFDGLFARDSSFIATHFYGLKLDYFIRFLDTVNAITPEKINEMANRYFALDDWSTVIVHPGE
ncbi:MAG: pitrilysin family protein [Salinivirgaceae bacterium]|jgi:zinc protease|nr:pitrilysin family protein [Salinivirgaceae bacterium]